MMTEISRDADRVWLAAGRRARLGWTPGPKQFDDGSGAHVHFALTVEPGALPALAERLSHRRRGRPRSPGARGR